LTEGMNLGRAEATAELFKIETAGLDKRGIKKLLKVKEKEMSSAVRELDFETAAILRDEIKAILHKLEVDQVRLTK